MSFLSPEDLRVLVLAPTGQDGRLLCQYIGRAEILAENCAELEQACRLIRQGAGALLLGEEVLHHPGMNALLDLLHQQPPWSDLAVILITQQGSNSGPAMRALEIFPNVVLLERPLRIPILLTTVRTALRARQRQYEVRAHLEELQRRQEELGLLVQRRDELVEEAQESRQRLERVLASISDGFMVLDEDWRVLSVNARAAENAGMQVGSMLGQSLWKLAGRSYDAPWRQQAELARDGGRSITFEHKDPVLGRWFEYRLYPSDTTLTVFEADVHERKMGEMRQRLLMELNDAIRPLRDPAEVMWAAARLVAKHFAVRHACYLEWDPVRGLQCVEEPGFEPATGVNGQIRAAEIPSPLIADLNRGLPVVVQDVRQDPRCTDTETEILRGIGATFLAIPVLRQELLTGALLVSDEAPRIWTSDDIALLEQVAMRAVLGVENVLAQKALRESEEQLELAVDGSRGGVFAATIDPEHPHRFAPNAFISPRAKAFLGFEDQELNSYRKWYARIHPEDQIWLRDRVREHLDGDTEFFEAEYRIRHRNGSWRWLQSRHRILRDNAGRPMRWAGIDWDITERKHSEEYQARLAALVDASLEAITGQTLDGVVTSWNPAAEAMYGYSASEMIGQSILRLVPPELQEELQHSLQRLRAGEQVREVETLRVRRDGTHFPVSLTLSPVEDLEGRPIAIATIERDVTERKQWERELRRATEEAQRRADEVEQSHLIMEALLENIPEGIVIAGGAPDFVIRSESKYGVKLAGPHFETLGMPAANNPFAAALRREDGRKPLCEELPLYRAARYGELVVNEEWTLALKNGGSLSLLCNAGPIRDAQGKVAGAVLTFRDISDRKRQENQLRELNETLEQRVRDRTRALMRHREQLRAMSAQLATAEQRERRRLASDLHDYLAQLLVVCRMKLGAALAVTTDPDTRASLEEMDALLDQSLTYTRTLVSRLSPTILYDAGLLPAVRWLADQLEKDGLKVAVHGVEVKMPDDTAILFFQGVRELLYNVIKHARTRFAEVLVDYYDGELLVEVSDQGEGFDPNAALQGPSADGQFGLFNVRERIEAAGGTFDLFAAPGRGTRVLLRMPLEHTEEAPLPARLPPVPKVISPTPPTEDEAVRVMLVDDHTIVREGLRRVIESNLEFRVVGEASNGEEAVNTVHSINPDVIVMDINMPRMNGLEATRIIKEMLPSVTVVGLSLEDNPEIRETMLRAGASAMVSKNGPSGEFYEILRHYARVRT